MTWRRELWILSALPSLTLWRIQSSFSVFRRPASFWILQPDHLLHVRQARGHGRIQARWVGSGSRSIGSTYRNSSWFPCSMWRLHISSAMEAYFSPPLHGTVSGRTRRSSYTYDASSRLYFTPTQFCTLPVSVISCYYCYYYYHNHAYGANVSF